MLVQGSQECPVDPNSRNPPSGNSCRCAQGDTCPEMFNIAPCTTAKKWKQSTWPSGGKWLNELCSIHPTNSTEQKNGEETGFMGSDTD